MTFARLCRRRESFRFLSLPTDLQVHVLSCMDLHTLHTTINAVPHAKDLYLEYPSSILRGATSVMGLQISNLILTIFSIIHTINSGVDVYTNQGTNVTSALMALLDSEEPQDISLLGKDALEAIEMLTKLDDEISYFVEEYAHDAYGRASQRDNPGVVPPPLVLSSSERYRIMRAFYRLKLFGVLFYNYADCFKVDLQSAYGNFFDCLSAFEIDELTTAYQYLVREGMSFVSAFPHNDCSYVPVKPYRDCRDPFNCETCRGRCLGPGNPSRPWWRGVQPFWHTLESRYVDRVGLWANPVVCRETPAKIWEDVTGPNEPNTGWLVWCTYRDLSHFYELGNMYVRDFRVLGYCFWDRERLQRWEMLYEAGSSPWPVA